VPATPLPAAPLVPVVIASSAPTTPDPVHTSLWVRSDRLNVLSGERSTIAGTLLEDHRRAPAGATVALQALGRRGWRTLAHARTGTKGRFRLTYTPRRSTREMVRLRFGGGPLALASHRRLGRLNAYHEAQPSSSNTGDAFVECVTRLESSMDWHIVDPPYSGGDQWTVGTWLAAGGGRYAPTAAQATPHQQIRVFRSYEPAHPSAWPVTVPACS